MSLAKYLIRCQERVRSQTSNSLRKTMVPAKVFVMDWTGDLRVKISESQRDCDGNWRKWKKKCEIVIYLFSIYSRENY